MKPIGKLLKLWLMIAMITLPMLLTAQPGLDDDVVDNPVPFDDGVYILLAIAVSYGFIKTVYKRKVNAA